jgi:hypothetical protein
MTPGDPPGFRGDRASENGTSARYREPLGVVPMNWNFAASTALAGIPVAVRITLLESFMSTTKTVALPPPVEDADGRDVMAESKAAGSPVAVLTRTAS